MKITDDWMHSNNIVYQGGRGVYQALLETISKVASCLCRVTKMNAHTLKKRP